MLTGSLTLAAFTYQNPQLAADRGLDVERELIAIDWQEQSQPKEPKTQSQDNNRNEQSAVTDPQQVSQQITTVSNTQTSVTSTTSIDLGGLVSKPVGVIGGIVSIDLEDKIEEYPKKEATFPGGYAAMQKFINENVVFPPDAVQFGDQGVVYLNFVVEKDGSISNVTVERGVTTSIDREAKKVVRKFPNWIPGESAYETVRTRVRLPISFVVEK